MPFWCSALFASLLFISTQVFANGKVEVDVVLSPTGSFKMKTGPVTGNAYKTADGIAAENVSVDLTSLTTDIALRDKHTKDRLKVEQFPQAKLIKASGKDGKGKATLEIKGKTIEVDGTYKIDGNMLNAEFPIDLPKLEITDVRYMGVGVKDTVVAHVSLPLGSAPAAAPAAPKAAPPVKGKAPVKKPAKPPSKTPPKKKP